ncbi:hypothetical protein MF406_13055 [Georgenia sp. TF02-10]|uniref:hypothetical protein n=1 Tax=Georgenia sp. TF02-10 TaxID=2917725 RepID=UPI001FA7C6EF|nr:hypothetical protein [Georgenia sp. TF02-10]UNX53893.1 hypothetical protein MF406_13055 [Georgenia sp. TF02-10]
MANGIEVSLPLGRVPSRSPAMNGDVLRRDIDWDALDLAGAFERAAQADSGAGSDGLLAAASGEDGANFFLVTVPSSPTWAAEYLFYTRHDGERDHFRISYIVRMDEPELTEAGCAYERREGGRRYHYGVLRRTDPLAVIRVRVGDSGWTMLGRQAGGWFVFLQLSDDPAAELLVEQQSPDCWEEIISL